MAVSIIPKPKKPRLARSFKLHPTTMDRLDDLAETLEGRLGLHRRPSRTAVLEAAVALVAELAQEKGDAFLRRLAESD